MADSGVLTLTLQQSRGPGMETLGLEELPAISTSVVPGREVLEGSLFGPRQPGDPLRSLHNIAWVSHTDSEPWRYSNSSKALARRKGISRVFLSKFLVRLWSCRRPRNITMFIWLMAHRGTAIGVWLTYSKLSTTWVCCSHAKETQRHCICPLAQQVWSKVL